MVYLDPKTRATLWSVTAFFDTENTPSKQTREYQIDAARSHQWDVQGQIEKCPTTGHLHYQLMIKTPQVRARSLMNIFPQAEVQVGRKEQALQNYVHKEDTRVEEIKVVKNYPSWTVVRDKFFEWMITHDENVDVIGEDRLQLWDTFIQYSLKEGVECDLIGVNPQYRSCILRYWNAYVYKAYHTSVDNNRQTDIQEVSLPIVENADEEKNDS